MRDLLRLDATALSLIGHDVAWLTDAELENPTPCEGWVVADLLRHMNERHEAVITSVLPPLEEEGDDPRAEFSRIAARWVVAMEQTGDIVKLPTFGPMPVERVLGVHFVDMLVHRWDLARALRRPCPVPEGPAEKALPLARASTAPGSPLNGPDGVYRPRLEEDPTRPTVDNLAALLGRDPHWTSPLS